VNTSPTAVARSTMATSCVPRRGTYRTIRASEYLVSYIGHAVHVIHLPGEVSQAGGHGAGGALRESSESSTGLPAATTV
ncbi:MAG TPA: hypothetical protein P5316_08290, partial [Phycisphaerae bacterium]|nr:hypothetical protein [Phycisphaerae bacterium]